MKTEYVWNIDREKKEAMRKVKPEHLFKKYQGFGVSVNFLEELIGYGIQTLIFHYEGVNGTIKYTCPIKSFITSSKTYMNKGDLQIFVSITDMQKV